MGRRSRHAADPLATGGGPVGSGRRRPRRAVGVLAALAIGLAPVAAPIVAPIVAPSAALAQAPSHGREGEAPARRAPERAGEARPEGRRLPPDATTEHTLTFPDGRSLSFTATAGSLALVDEAGKLQAEIAFVAYARTGKSGDGKPGDGKSGDGKPEAVADRPITFGINGGPGAASAYLNIGAIGPWRLPTDGASISPSQRIALAPNAATWLDFTDLVFLDPVGTGYSRAADGDAKKYWSVDADASVLAAAIARYLRANDRLASPKFYVGESYGGFRGPLIAGKLQDDAGAALSGLVLLSPVLDFAWLQSARTTPWAFATRLPSFAAAAMERAGTVPTRGGMAEAERYAAGDYLADLLKGPGDREAVARLAARVASLSGLDPDLVRRQAGRISANSYQRAIGRDEGRVASAYDTAVTGWDPDPTAERSGFEDPLLSALQAPLSSAMIDFYANTLNWRVTNMRYELLNNAVTRGWTWGSGRQAPEAMGALKDALALDGNLRVLVAHGFTDLVTPYFASKLLIDQVPPYGDGGRLSLAVYPGGHMFYARAESRAAFRADVAALFAAALRARSDGAPSGSAPRGEGAGERRTP